jgi:AsmA family protein
VQIDAIEGVVLAIDRATARLALSDGVLDVSPARFGSAGGRVEIHAKIDAAAKRPAWRLRALADDAQLGELWRELQTEVPVEGELDLELDLRARGHSPRALAASLDGALGLAVERGRIQSRLFGLTTMHPLGWLFARSTRAGYSRLDCAIVRFDVREGVAEARALLVDTPDAIVTGTGSIDLTREAIDLQMQPRAKQRGLVGLATPFTIRGDLAAPVVSVSAAGTAARIAGEVALTPIMLLGSLLPLVSDRGRDAHNPCLKVGGG